MRAYANTANVGDIAEEENRENGKENNKGDNKEYRLPAVDEEGLRQRNPDYAAWLCHTGYKDSLSGGMARG